MTNRISKNQAPWNASRASHAIATLSFGWLCLSVGACRTEHCTGGDLLDCGGGDRSECEKVAGCRWVPGCRAVPCFQETSQARCENLTGCVWLGESCLSQSDASCHAASTKENCEAMTGCGWWNNDANSGSPIILAS